MLQEKSSSSHCCIRTLLKMQSKFSHTAIIKAIIKQLYYNDNVIREASGYTWIIETKRCFPAAWKCGVRAYIT